MAGPEGPEDRAGDPAPSAPAPARAPKQPPAGPAPIDRAQQVREDPEMLAAAERWLDDLDRRRPDLTRGEARPGYLRGIDVYKPKRLIEVLAYALDIFTRTHGRLPDLDRMPGFADPFFQRKFFDYMPMAPNPADKIAATAYVPETLRPRMILPRRPWMSDKPELPPDDAVPPGRYFLKRALGNADQVQIRWPITRKDRERLQPILERWDQTSYGVRWGEWWYGTRPARIFLEQDMSEWISGRPEWRVYVRDGKARLCNLILQQEDVNRNRNFNTQRWFDAEMRPLAGVTKGRVQGDFTPTPHAERFLEAAVAIAERFDLVRIDMFDAGRDMPVLSEITLCDYNARRRFDPPESEPQYRALLFGDA